jgi:hypothetical protein
MARTQKTISKNERASTFFITNALERYREDNDFAGIERKTRELLKKHKLKIMRTQASNIRRLLKFYMYHEYHGNRELLPTYTELNYF